MRAGGKARWGFAKRKAQRRKEAAVKLAARAQKEKLAVRKGIRDERAKKLREVGFVFEDVAAAVADERAKPAKPAGGDGTVAVATEKVYGDIAVTTAPMTLGDDVFPVHGDEGEEAEEEPVPLKQHPSGPSPSQPRRSEKALLRIGQKLIAKTKKTGPMRARKQSKAAAAAGGKMKQRNKKR